jgi:hypothetical protein
VNQDGPVDAFRSVDHNTSADVESCHATIAALSPQCIAAYPVGRKPIERAGKIRRLDDA